MAEPIFRIDDLRNKVVELLRKKGVGMKAGAMAQELILPMWAVYFGLESAMDMHLVDFVSPEGVWVVKAQEEVTL